MANNLDQQLRALLKRLTDPEILAAAGEELRRMIVERVRGGRGVPSPGSPTRSLAPLSPAYIKQRARDPRLSAETSPATSNLTRHGDMLDALQVKVSGTSVSVFIPAGDELKKAIYTNALRPWVNISKGEATRLREFIAKRVKENL